MQKKDYLVWMDMEMSGLDPEKNTILEIASLITDSNLRIIDEGPNLVIHQPLKILKAMDTWNQEHHKKSGLTEAVMQSKLRLKKAETATLDFIRHYCLPNTAPLCGNSIHHDRRFLARFMPRVHRYLHYRMIDVSAIKEVIRRWYVKPLKPPAKAQKHRALADILESLEELQFYRQHYFKKTRPNP